MDFIRALSHYRGKRSFQIFVWKRCCRSSLWVWVVDCRDYSVGTSPRPGSSGFFCLSFWSILLPWSTSLCVHPPCRLPLPPPSLSNDCSWPRDLQQQTCFVHFPMLFFLPECISFYKLFLRPFYVQIVGCQPIARFIFVCGVTGLTCTWNFIHTVGVILKFAFVFRVHQ